MYCSAIILAGGRGVRAGGIDKGLLVTGTAGSLLRRVLARLSGQVGDITISANRNLTRYRESGYPVVSDTLAGFQGPLAGLQAALPHCQRELVVVVSCDTPLLPLDLAERLLAPLQQDKSIEASYAHDGQRDHYLCCALRRDIHGSLAPYLSTGARSVRGWLAQRRTAVVDFSDQPVAFTNLNTPAT